MALCINPTMSVQLVLRPRLEVVRHSLWWKEALEVETRCLPDQSMEAVRGDQPLSALLSQAAQSLGWPPTNELLRLEGFDQPWERALVRGREMDLSKSLDDQAAELSKGCEGEAPPLVITYVRRALKADGWKVCCSEGV